MRDEGAKEGWTERARPFITLSTASIENPKIMKRRKKKEEKERGDR